MTAMRVLGDGVAVMAMVVVAGDNGDGDHGCGLWQ